MAYQPMTLQLDDIPRNLDDLPEGLTYRSPPRRFRETLDPQDDTIIEVSDDETDRPRGAQAPPAQQTRRGHRPSRDIVSVSSTSDADISDMDIAVIPPLTHKRSRTAGSSLGSSPHTTSRTSGKRRATPADSLVLVAAAPQQAHSKLQLQRHAPNDGGAQSDKFTVRPRSIHRTKRKAKSAKKKEAKQTPYYVDGRLDVKMYRGPGYERFPVVLGTVEGHQEICEKWDADQLVKLERKEAKLRQAIRTPYMVHDTESDSSDDSAVEEKAAFEKRCLDSVLEVFPDIERAFIEKEIRDAPPQPQYFDEDDDEIVQLGAPPLAERIISEVLEMQSYPKERFFNSKANGKGTADDGTGITITWDRTLPKDKMYNKDAVILLAKQFVHVPTHYIAKIVEERSSIFDTYVAIQESEDQYYTIRSKPYPRRKQPRADLEKKYMLQVSDRRIPAEYANRVNELQAAKQHVAREGIKEAAKKAKEEAEASNLAEHIKAGAIMECQCCFDAETPLNRMVPCTTEFPHNFCFSCVESLADTQVGMLKYEMLCMDASGCTAKLSHEDVGRAIPITTFDRLELNQQQAEIMAANIEGLEQCPSCDYKAICGDVKEEPIFYCQNPECSRASCRKCKKDNHTPKTCEENSRDKVLSARHIIEEARSEAVMRTCQKCKAKIVKEFGCNKMTCTRCGSLFCYNCNEDITHLGGNAYSHFGRKCILYDEQGADRHDNEANEAEKTAISKAKAVDAELDESKLRIDTGKTGKTGKTSKVNPAMQNLQNHPAGQVFIRDLNNRAARLNHHQAHLQNMQARVEHLEALRPDPELEAILAELHAMDGAIGMDRIPPQHERMQQIQQLLDLQRRAQANFAQYQLQQIQPLPQPGQARRGREVHRPQAFNRAPNPAVNRAPNPAVNRTPNPVITQALNPAITQAPNPALNPPALPHVMRNDPALPAAGLGLWPEGFDDLFADFNQGPLFDLPRFDFNFAGAQAAMLEPYNLAPNPPGYGHLYQVGLQPNGMNGQAFPAFQGPAGDPARTVAAPGVDVPQVLVAAGGALAQAQRDAARVQREAAQAQIDAAQAAAQRGFAQAQRDLAAVGAHWAVDADHPPIGAGGPAQGAQHPVFQFQVFPPHDIPGGMGGVGGQNRRRR